MRIRIGAGAALATAGGWAVAVDAVGRDPTFTGATCRLDGVVTRIKAPVMTRTMPTATARAPARRQGRAGRRPRISSAGWTRRGRRPSFGEGRRPGVAGGFTPGRRAAGAAPGIRR